MRPTRESLAWMNEQKKIWKAEGRCVKCGAFELVTKTQCKKHADADRQYKRDAYRKKVGKPLDAPLAGNGRKRMEDK